MLVYSTIEVFLKCHKRSNLSQHVKYLIKILQNKITLEIIFLDKKLLLVISQNCQTVLAQYYRLFIMFREMFQMKNSLSCTQCIIIPSWYFHDTMYTALPLGTYFQIFSNTQTTQYNYSQCWYTRVGWWISKVCADRVTLKHLYIETKVGTLMGKDVFNDDL